MRRVQRRDIHWETREGSNKKHPGLRNQMPAARAVQLLHILQSRVVQLLLFLLRTHSNYRKCAHDAMAAARALIEYLTINQYA